MLKRNILANMLGSGWTAVLVLAVTPVQVHLLGIEAFGLIGLIAVLQVVLSSLDLGLSATATQAIAADHSEGRRDSLKVLRSAATVFWILAALIALVLWTNAAWIAERWLGPTTLPRETVILAVRVIAVYLALRWPISFYAGVIAGHERMDITNAIKSAAVTLRLGGGVIVLLIDRDLTSFLAWFALTAGLELAAVFLAAHRLAPGLGLRPEFSLRALKSMWRFSAAMGGIALIAVVLTQLDRLMVTRILGLEALGYYALAYNACTGISMLQTGINNAALPTLARARSAGRHEEVGALHERLSQGMGYLTGLPAVILMTFSHDILRLWISPAAADAAWLPTSLLALGFFFNAMVSSAYITSVACGRPDLPLKVNLAVLILYVPALYGLIRFFGIDGAASAWIALNVVYLFTMLPLVHGLLLQKPVLPWISRCVAPFLVMGLIIFGAMRALSGWALNETVTWAVVAFGCLAYAAVGFRLLAPALRSELTLIAYGARATLWSRS